MAERPLTFMLARLANAGYFALTSAYCLFVFNPFTHSQFIQHEYLWWLSAFVAHHAALYWVALLLTTLTLVPLSRTPGVIARQAQVYLAVMTAIGVYLAVRPVLPTVGETNRTLVFALAALVPPMWLSLIDHFATPLGFAVPQDRRVFEAAMVSAAVIWLVFGIGVPIRLGRAIGVDVPAGWLLPAVAVSAAAHVLVFLAVFAALFVALRVARALPSPGRAAYWLLVTIGAAAVAGTLVDLVFAAIALTGPLAWIFGSTMGACIALAWAGAARHSTAARSGEAIDPLGLLLTPMTLVGSRVPAAILLGLMPAIAFALVTAVAEFDWNFLVQKLTVLAIWFVCFGLVYGLLAGRRLIRIVGVTATPLVIAAFLSAAVVAAPRTPSTTGPMTLELALDRYAAVDPSFRLIRDARAANAGHTSAFYAFLTANTLVAPGRARPADIDFAPLDSPTPGPRPNIFLIVVDSLRPDYLSPYNARVTFTPEIERFAKDSVVFTRTFARYGGTNLSVPSIWAGGMLIHQLEPGSFDGRDALLKLVDADGYRALVSMDSVVRTLVPHAPNVTPLDANLSAVDFELCRTIDEMERSLDDNSGDRRPVFAYALPQNIHIAVAIHTKVPEGESYPGFFAQVAHGVRGVDRCFGRFIDYLKRTGRYDNSIVILTSDHGDSLGEDGRYGHSLFMFPEVVRIPLIVHLPAALRDRVTSDRNQVSFSTDLTPTLYALAGHRPADLGPLFGSPLFVPAGSNVPSRSEQSYLLASSYGAVYALLSDNGRRLYIADAVDGRDYAFALRDDGPDLRVELTPAMTEESRRLIREHLSALAALNHYQAEP